MHGRPRLPPGQSADHTKDQVKAKKLHSLLEDVLRNHHERCYTKEALKQSAQLLELNPEFYTAWNYRKVAVRHLLDSETDDEAARKGILENELRVVEIALRANIKSYGAWYHRKWVIGLVGHSSLEHEFFLLQKLLKIDSRNFHAWRHRRFCVEATKAAPEKELQYATEKINENFSNYSAWHYRSTLLSQLVAGGLSKEKILADEYELVNQAYFTEPEDQSAWFYNTWLLGETKMDSGARLIGTWPPDGSTVRADLDKESSTITFTSRNPVDAEYNFDSAAGLPLVLSFSEVVTDMAAKVSSSPPELGHLSDVRWRPLSGVLGPSKTWLADVPLQGCSEGEYGLSVKISPQSGDCQEAEVKFSLTVSSAGAESNAKRLSHEGVHSFSWPGEEIGTGERRERLEKGVDETASVSNLSSEDSQRKNVTTSTWEQRLLEEQIQSLRELLELEPKSKWAKLTLSKVMVEWGARSGNHGLYMDEVLDLLKELMLLDPYHAAYYESLLSSLFIAKVLRSRNGLKQVWWEPAKRDHDEHLETTSGWLRWSGLSLTKFDCVERLLWVQRLDLSHNKLRSVDGLEAAQLLVALDLSHNLIPNVTALAPLRLNPRLQYLDISHNDIGGHPVDSSRYSFPSLLNNQEPCFSKEEERELQEEVKGGGAQWEIQAVFGGLKLRLLQISGNVAAGDKSFVRALVKALPSLELLDGEQVQ